MVVRSLLSGHQFIRADEYSEGTSSSSTGISALWQDGRVTLQKSGSPSSLSPCTFGVPDMRSYSHDVDLPERSDDQYLDNIGSSSNWRQPPGTPSRMDYFIHAIKLYRILYLTLNSMVFFILPIPAHVI